jgi:glycerol-3-phosphate acyltransferase PlsX
MGGDNAPDEMLKGAVAAKKELGGDYALVGHEQVLRACASKHGLDISGFEILHAEETVTMEDDAMAAVKRKKNSSMAVGLRTLAEGGGDALVSCGNTGALFSGATLITKRVKGIHRAAIATVLPFDPPVLLLDSGANVVVTTEHLMKFAVMGAGYYSKLFGVESPKVGLLSNGTEETKGTPLCRETYEKLMEAKDALGINFIGNVEASAVPFGECHVLVTDGFTGNILLKTVEGAGKLVMGRLKGMFYSSPLTKLSALIMKKHLAEFKHSFDATEHGGSPILGISKPVIKAHGSSNAKAFKNAIRQAKIYAESDAIDHISRVMTSVDGQI